MIDLIVMPLRGIMREGKMKHIFIINPVAGNGKYQIELEKTINSYFKGKEECYEIYVTRGRGDSKYYVEEKCKDNKPYIFYACGGDGTLHEVVNIACKYNHVSVGLIPCGSGNDFVKNFTSNDNFYNIDMQINGNIVPIDLIKIKDEYAVSVCNIGFDADVAFNMHKFKRIPFISGPGCYYLSVLYSLLKRLGKALEIEFDDGHVIKDNFLLSVVANGTYYGGGYKCAPYAGINDGLLDVCLVKKVSRFKILNLIDKYKKGEHLINKAIKKICTYKKCRKVSIKSNFPINLCIDGESYVYNEIDLEIAESVVNFNIPKNSQICEQAVLEETLNLAY